MSVGPEQVPGEVDDPDARRAGSCAELRLALAAERVDALAEIRSLVGREQLDRRMLRRRGGLFRALLRRSTRFVERTVRRCGLSDAGGEFGTSRRARSSAGLTRSSSPMRSASSAATSASRRGPGRERGQGRAGRRARQPPRWARVSPRDGRSARPGRGGFVADSEVAGRRQLASATGGEAPDHGDDGCGDRGWHRSRRRWRDCRRALCRASIRSSGNSVMSAPTLNAAAP